MVKEEHRGAPGGQWTARYDIAPKGGARSVTRAGPRSGEAGFPTRPEGLAWIRKQQAAIIADAGIRMSAPTMDDVDGAAAAGTPWWVTWELEGPWGRGSPRDGWADPTARSSGSAAAGLAFLDMMSALDGASWAPLQAAMNCLGAGGSVIVHGLAGSRFADVTAAIADAAGLPVEDRWDDRPVEAAIASGAQATGFPGLWLNPAAYRPVLAGMRAGVPACCAVLAPHAHAAMLAMVMAGRKSLPPDLIGSGLTALQRSNLAILAVETEQPGGTPRVVRAVCFGKMEKAAP